MRNAKGTESPSAVLRVEHQNILRVIGVLRRLVERAAKEGAFERESLARCVEFFRLYADACHHAKEEDLLFPAMEARGVPRDGGPIGVMLYEHTVARKHTREMGAALEAAQSGDMDGQPRFLAAARAYIDLLAQHIFKEDNVLFNIGDHVMTETDQRDLCKRVCEVGCRSFGGKTSGALEQLAAELESQWPGE
jgi:hemerythrin-like domain-containing protein